MRRVIKERHEHSYAASQMLWMVFLRLYRLARVGVLSILVCVPVGHSENPTTMHERREEL
jgi:hypothetical protein